MSAPARWRMAGSLARQSLAAAESAGLAGWAADVAIGALQVIGDTENVRDIVAARAAFERAYQIADARGRAIGRIDALQELGTIEMREDGTGQRLRQAGELARAAGALVAAIQIDIKLALLLSIGPDLEPALAAARRCEDDAARIGARRIHALAVAAQAFMHAISGDATVLRFSFQMTPSTKKW